LQGRLKGRGFKKKKGQVEIIHKLKKEKNKIVQNYCKLTKINGHQESGPGES